MDKQLFFAVFGNKDLLGELKKYMYPGKKVANYYDYRNGNIAAFFGYLGLIKERSLSYSKNAIDWAAKSGHLEVVKFLHENRKEGCTTSAMNLAAGNGHLNVVKFLHENRKEGCTYGAMFWAKKNGHFDIVSYIEHFKTQEKLWGKS